MTKRALLGALGGGKFGLKVSKPGFDVTAPSTIDKRLSFDSTVSKTMRVLMRNRLSVSSGSGKLVVNFGVTLSSLPIVFYLWRAGSSSEWSQPLVGGGWANAPLSDQPALLEVYRNRIELSRPTSGSRVFSFIVLRP
jgi:hypothetical protein